MKWLIAILGVALAALVLFFVTRGTSEKAEEPEPSAEPAAAVSTPEPTPESTPEPTPEPKESHELSDEELAALRKELQDDQAINSDVKCLLHFNNGLVHDPVLQSGDENYYLYKDWKTHEYLSYGSIVLDSRNDITADEMNTIIYGHYIYEFRNADRTLVFTPLAQLMERSVWEENKYVTLLLNDEVRYYEIAKVYDCPLEEVNGGQFTIYGLEYNLLYYDPEYLSLYEQNIHSHEYYDTGISLSPEDHFLTLQTCIENHHESREIVLCREIERKPLTTE